MKKTILSLTLAALCLAALGAFAAETAISGNSLAHAVEALEAETASADAAEAALAELFADPLEAGACCFAQCFELWQACGDACGGLFPSNPCNDQCDAEKAICTRQC